MVNSNIVPTDPTPAPDAHDHWIKDQLTYFMTNNPAFIAAMVKASTHEEVVSEIKAAVDSDFSSGGPFSVFAQQINTDFSAGLIVEYLMGRWDGLHPGPAGTRIPWNHPLTGKPITDSERWIK